MERRDIVDYNWLQPYHDALVGKDVLELGCGPGVDTRVISTLAKSLVATDRERDYHCPHPVLVLDHSRPLPFRDKAFDTVVASLCLHYFRMEKTREIVQEICRVLIPGGTLVCRVNSHQDKNYGSVGYSEIEPGLYDVNGGQKRFFKEREIHEIWSHRYSVCGITHKQIDRYQKPKCVYEFIAIKE